MDFEDFIALDGLSNLTPNQIAKQRPEMFKRLEVRLSERLQHTITTHFKDEPDAIREIVGKMRFKNATTSLPSREIAAELSIASLSKDDQKAGLDRLAKLNLPAQPRALMHQATPIAANPLFAKELATARSFRIAKESDLRLGAAERIVKDGGQLFTLKDDDLTALVQNGILEKKEASRLGRRLSLYRILDEDFGLLNVVQEALRLPDVGGAADTLRPLAQLDADKWVEMLERADTPPPPGMERVDHGRLIERKVAALFPSAAMQRKITARKTLTQSALDGLKPLLGAGIKTSQRPDATDYSPLDTSDRTAAKRAHGQAFALIAAFPGLQLGNVLDDVERDPQDRATEIEKRLGAVRMFQKANADVDFLTMDLTPANGALSDMLHLDDIDDGMKPLVIAHARALQRSFSVTDEDALDAAELVNNGFASANQIAAVTRDTFVSMVPFNTDTAVAYYDKAMSIAADAGVAAVGVYDAVAGGFGWLEVSNVSPDIGDYFRQIDGWETFFGAQTFCDCPACGSILSPAAYYADLMKFIEDHVLSAIFVGDDATAVLSLRERRPDLWTLPLTCSNTDTEIPLLVVITEIFETYIARRRGFAGPMSNRTQLARFVYRDHIAQTLEAFTQPLVLPHAILETYLGHFQLSRDVVLPFVKVAAETRQAIRLGVPKVERDAIAQPNTARAFLRRIYDENFSGAGAQISPFDSQVLVRATGLDRAAVGLLVKARFVTNLGTETLRLKAEKRDSNSVQFDIERARGFTLGALDRMHRFVRLHRATGLGFEALDAIDAAVRQSGRGADLTAALNDVAEIQAMSARFGADIDTCASLMGHLSTSPDRDGKTLLNRSFNADYHLDHGVVWPDGGVAFVHPTHAINPTPQGDLDMARLCSGLKVKSETLAELIAYLAAPLGATLDGADDAVRSFALDDDNLGLCFRHAMLLDWLDMSVTELGQLIALSPDIAGVALNNFDDVIAVIEFAGKVAAAPITLDALAKAAGLTDLAATPETDPTALAQSLVDRIVDGGGSQFAPTLFVDIQGLTDTQSRAIVAANAGVFEPVSEEAFRIMAGTDLAATLTLPAGIVVNDALLKDRITPHSTGALLAEAIAGHMGVTREVAQSFITLSGLDVNAAGVMDALRGDADPAVLVAPVTAIIRFAATANLKNAAPEAVIYAANNLALFGAASVATINAAVALRIAAFATFKSAMLPNMTQILEGFSSGSFDALHAEALGEVLGVTSSAAMALNNELDLPAGPFEALGMLQVAAGVTRTLGITARVLVDMASDDYDRLEVAANAVVAAMRLAHPDDADWKAVSETYAAEVLNAKRDGLVAFLLHSINPEFETVGDLYRFFLLDPEVDGCFPTSRVVANISSAQAYVHRVLMNLEQSENGDIQVDPSLIPRDEWEWRKNFRVWQANRKVYLWTENYLDPEFRDNKTHLFDTFESEVLQSELDEQAILDAYSRYLEGFEVLANLSIAGSYHAIDDASETDVLHLIGVTPGDPPTFFYRTAENVKFGRRSRTKFTKWNHWQPINIKIPVREVSPVVHDGRLHLFWAEIVTTSQNAVKDAGSKFIGYKHRLAIKFSTLRLDGEWTVPQSISLYKTPPFGETDGIVDDPLAEPEEIDAFIDAIKDMFGFGVFSQDRTDLSAATRQLLTPRYDDEPHSTAREGYTLGTPEWTRVFPQSTVSGIRLSGAGYQMRAMVDLFDKDTKQAPGSKSQGRIKWTKNASAPSPILSERGGQLYFGQIATAPFDDYAFVSLAADAGMRNRVQSQAPDDFRDLSDDGLFQAKLANLRGAAVYPVNGSLIDAVIDRSGDLLLFQGTAFPGQAWAVQRIGTTLARSVARALFTEGLDGLLATTRQAMLSEAPTPIHITSSAVVDGVKDDGVDFDGPFGTYYREIFFHVPLLLAKTLQGQGNHAEAKKWYEYIFNPTTTEVIPNDPTLDAMANARRQRDRNWRYIEFRSLGIPQLRQILNNEQAIATYREDPFNPHAIARLRMSSYQKSVVMSYVDNLIDWGDKLFSQFQQEPINEAIMLYQTARDILGPRPVQIGDCGQTSNSRTYEEIKPALDAGTDFLAEMENYVFVGSVAVRPGLAVTDNLGLVLATEAASAATWKAVMSQEMKGKGLTVIGESQFEGRRTTIQFERTTGDKTVAFTSLDAKVTTPARVEEGLINPAFAAVSAAPAEPDPRLGAQVENLRARFVPGTAVAAFDDLRAKGRDTGPVSNPGGWKDLSKHKRGRLEAPRFVLSVVKTISPVFCIPGNTELLEYWDRVDDRLYKIHNCLDINGNRRQLSLFAPEIDPRALIRARAAGLSTDDVLAALNGSAPPLRFSLLLDRAKQFASTVQAFGGSLQAALERKDGEELNLMRMSQAQDILAQTTRMRHWEYDISARNLEATQARQQTLVNALGRVEAMADTGLITSESIQRVAHHTASALRGVEATLGFLSGALHLVPQLGSPFAMKYGGVEIGTAAHRLAVGTRALADLASIIASSASLEATFSRRAEGWKNQIAQSKDQLKELEKEIASAELRRDIAERAIELHDLSIAHAEELQEQADNKFGDLDFHTWSAATLQRIHRDAYNCALSMARMAESAYRFERNDQVSELLSGDYWAGGRSGLHAGSRLLVELQNLEKRHIETTPTSQEIDQTFSLFQMDPAALIALKATGTTTFEIPEHFCDIYYPGHYLRMIKALRITIPSVTGPNANVSAMLTLEDSFVRRGADPAAALQALPTGRGQTVSTSTAQNDGGRFELNFGGAKYLPFEGAGVVSRWRLTLPNPEGFPPFDYRSISDVLLRVSYTAEYDNLLRNHVETQNVAVAGTLTQMFSDTGLQRVISLRQEHNEVFQRLITAPLDTPTDLTIGQRHFPIFVGGRDLSVTKLRLAVDTTGSVGALAFDVDGDGTAAFGAAADLGGMPTAAVAPQVGNDPRATLPVAVTDAGDLVGGAGAALDGNRIRDILVIVDYTIGGRS